MKLAIGQELVLRGAIVSTGRVMALETSHILIEIDGLKDQWHEPMRRWLPIGAFEPEVVLVRTCDTD